jgi:uncharacterized membrane protein YeaQ/YmgE (transglycosylase-associated protein family)
MPEKAPRRESAPVRCRTDAGRFRPYLVRSLTGKGRPCWCFCGSLVGFVPDSLTSRFVNETGKGLFVDVLIGVVGAVVAGWLATSFGLPDSGANRYGMLAAIVGAIALLVCYRQVFNKA